MKFFLSVGAIALVMGMLATFFFMDGLKVQEEIHVGQTPAPETRATSGPILVAPPKANGEQVGSPDFMPANFVGPTSPPGVKGPTSPPPGNATSQTQ